MSISYYIASTLLITYFIYRICKILITQAVNKAVRSERWNVTKYLFYKSDHLWDNKIGTSAPFEIEKVAWEIWANKHKPEKK